MALRLRSPHKATCFTLKEAIVCIGNDLGNNESYALDTAAEEASEPSSKNTDSYDNRATIGERWGFVVCHRLDKRGPKEQVSALLEHSKEEKNTKTLYVNGGADGKDCELRFFAKIAVILHKRWMIQRRDCLGFVAQVLLPAMTIAVVLVSHPGFPTY